MVKLELELVEKDYEHIKKDFQEKPHSLVAREIADEMPEHAEKIYTSFLFLLGAFRGKLRKDKMTPLEFHSLYLSRMLYNCGEKGLDQLLTAAFHDVLEDTEVTEEVLRGGILRDRKHIIPYIKMLTLNPNLSAYAPMTGDGRVLPPIFEDHLKRMTGGPVEVINTELVDRFSELMDLYYLTKVPNGERIIRLDSKFKKVRVYADTLIKGRSDYNQNAANLLYEKLRNVENSLKSMK